MKLLSHSPAQTGNPSRQARHSSAMRAPAVATDAHWATVKRFCLFAFMILLAGGAVVGVIALKTEVYLSSLN